jgi:hypothetical protein
MTRGDQANLFTGVSAELLARGCRVRFRADGWSMHPTIRPGESITVEPAQPAELQVGDIGLYRTKRGVIAHRVIEIHRTETPVFLTRGDAAKAADAPVNAGQILGRVVAVERHGRVIDVKSRRAKMNQRLRSTLSNSWNSFGRALQLFALLIALCVKADAAVAFVSAASSDSSNVAALTVTITHNFASGTNGLLLVGVSIVDTDPAVTVSSVSYRTSQALTFVGSAQSGTGDAAVRVEIWMLKAPVSGANPNQIVVTLSAAAKFAAGTAYFTGVNQTLPLGPFLSTTTTGNTSTTLGVLTDNNGGAFSVLAIGDDVGAGSNAPSDAAQTERWDNPVGGSNDDVEGSGGTAITASATTVPMGWTWTGTNTAAEGAVRIRPDTATAITPTSLTAVRAPGGVLLGLATTHEANSLGFNLYREQQGRRIRLNSSLLAGSALLAGGNALTAGRNHTWWDDLPGDTSGVAYWVEEVDLYGTRSWHGPVTPEQARPGDPLRTSLAKSERSGRILSSLGAAGAGDSQPLEVTAVTPADSASRLATQRTLAASRTVKISVRHEGWYRVGRSELLAAGLDPAADWRNLQLFADGEEVVLAVNADSIEFYGVGLDTPWSDTRVYWLAAGSGPGRRLAEQGGGAASPVRSRSVASTGNFPFTVERRDRTVYFAALRNGDADNFFGPVVSGEPVNQILSLSRLDPNGSDARLEVALQGVSASAHRVTVRLNGSDLGAVELSGQERGLGSFGIPVSRLREGQNIVTLVSQGESDASLVDTLRLTYPHAFTADDGLLRLSAPGGQRLTLDGFPNARIRVVDVTDPSNPASVAGAIAPRGPDFSVTIQTQGPGRRRLLAFTDTRLFQPAALAPNQPSRWQEAGAGADVVLITHAALRPSLAPLRALRESQGRTVALVDVEDLYDEFGFGAKSPQALKDFVAAARANWQRAPRSILLVGDATFDPRDFLQTGAADFVPTRLLAAGDLETASDDWFVDADNDGVAELAIGRLPARTPEEAATMIAKILDYERAGPGGWRNEVLAVSDANDDDNNFEAGSANLRSLLPGQASLSQVLRGAAGNTARADLLDRLNRGVGLVNYLGHGSVEVWRGGLLNTDDVRGLANGSRLPIVVAMTCLNGFFQDVYTESLAEAFLRAPRGGAVAVWASSGLTSASGQLSADQELLRGLYSGQGLTLGEAVMRAKRQTGDPDIRRTWILFGDPAMRLE